MKALSMAAVLALVAMHTSASANPELAQKRTCMACHAVDRKIVGPAYKDVAARYAGQREAVELLAVKIVKGGSGAWGAVPMPANPQVNAARSQDIGDLGAGDEVTGIGRRQGVSPRRPAGRHRAAPRSTDDPARATSPTLAAPAMANVNDGSPGPPPASDGPT